MNACATQKNACPGCRIQSPCVGGVLPGDYAICLGCGAMAIVDEDLSRRDPTEAEFEAGLEIPELMTLMTEIQKFNRNN